MSIVSTKISELPILTSVDNASDMIINEGGVTSKATKTVFLDGAPIKLQVVALAESTDATQFPSGLNAPLQVNYGSGFATNPYDGVSPIEITTAGTTIFHEEFIGYVSYEFNVGRTGTGGTANLLFRTVAATDGGAFDEQAGRTIPISITSASDSKVFSVMFPLYCPAGCKVKQEVIRDGGGADAGGLVQFTPAVSAISPAVTQVECAKILYHKLVSGEI